MDIQLNNIANRTASWSGVFAMTVCVFALVASEFMPVSLLTPIAVDLQVSEGLAGQAISMSGAFAVVTSLSILLMAGRMDRKVLLLWMAGLMLVSGAVIASAQSFTVYMIGRALIGVSIGGFWSLSAAAAIRLVPPADVTRALAVFNGGNALATVVAAPLGSFLGSVIGWRGAFFCLVPVALIALGWLWVSLPSMKAGESGPPSSNPFRLLRQPLVALGMAAVGVFFMGQFALYTYLRPFLETVTHVSVATLSVVLLIIGIAGFAGTTLIGRFLEKNFYKTLIVIPVLMAAVALALVATGGWTIAVALLLALWGLVGTAAPVGWWSWVARTLPRDAEAGGGLMVAVVQLSIGLGSTLGGLLFDASGYAATFMLSAALLAGAAWLALLTSRRDGPLAATPPALS